MYGSVLKLHEKAIHLTNQIAEKKDTVSNEAVERATLTEIATSEVLIQSYIVPEEKVAAFIEDLQSRGRLQGATVTIMSVSKSGIEAPTLNLSLSITGKFDAVMRTVGMIEYAPYNLMFSSLNLSQNTKDTWHLDMRVVVSSEPATPRVP